MFAAATIVGVVVGFVTTREALGARETRNSLGFAFAAIASVVVEVSLASAAIVVSAALQFDAKFLVAIGLPLHIVDVAVPKRIVLVAAPDLGEVGGELARNPEEAGPGKACLLIQASRYHYGPTKQTCPIATSRHHYQLIKANYGVPVDPAVLILPREGSDLLLLLPEEAGEQRRH